MEIQKIILTKPVTIYGNNIWGNPAVITFSPISSGWFFRDEQTGEDMPINKHTVGWDIDNVFIKNKKSEIRMFKHILLMRWLGLDGVAISGTMWPPYYSAMEYFSYLRDSGSLFATKENIKSFAIEKIYSSDDFYEKSKGAYFGPVGTVLVPFKETIFKEDYSFKNIAIDVYINYPGIGKLYKFYGDLISVLYSVIEIYPYKRKDILDRYNILYQELVSNDLSDDVKIGWINHYKNETLLNLSKNRVSCIMSTMAMIKHDALPLNFRFSSYCGRHSHDLRMTKGVSNSYA